ncbi:MAG: hypothetical protein BWY28_02293 [bacterium ADurb.Bin236]|nr:MAG: hypothetical protein BWY28_02293 [bacterium ADurb.Bin236]
MITKWTVANFKSISKEETLPLAPLTIFAGPNSSGKSTFLQSILLISQTLSHKISSRSVVLNGTLTRLGQFDDLKSFRSETDIISIGWECHPTEDGQIAIIDGLRIPGPATVYGRRIESIKEVSCKLSFDTNPGSPDRDLFQLQPQLFLFNMSLLVRGDDNTDKRFEITITRSQSGSSKMNSLQIKEPDNKIAIDSLEYDIVLDDNSLIELNEDFATAEPVGCVLKHFLPDRISIRVNTIEELARQIYMILVEESPRYYRRPVFNGRDILIPEMVVQHLQSKIDDKFRLIFDRQQTLFDIESGIPVREWADRVRRLPPDMRREFRRALLDCSDLPQTIMHALRAQRNDNESEFELRPFRPPMDLMNASAYLEYMFSNSVKYLGPLRDEPKPLYPLAAYADPTDVGLRGEMTAAVLNLHKEKRVRFIPPSAFEKTPFNFTPTIRYFESAVTEWLRYLGVAESAKSFDKGKLGHELKITLSEDGPVHDLTHVGVGVSQVLPILVMSLLADRDTVLVFEQPELHLHPKVQTRLADFFLSIVLMGKQCLVETHSEYLVNRLRNRVAAEDENNRVNSHLKVYFVEKEGATSTFQEVEVNDYGAVKNWPKGFFDQSQREEEEILIAAAKKRKNKREKQ